MRPGQNKRMRGRNNNNRKGPNPLTRSYESNGPDVKIRGTAHHIGEKYLQLARDAQSSGDPVMAESYLQHAEHYFRLIAAAQQAQQQAQFGYQRQPGDAQDSDDDDGDEDFAALPDRFASPGERQPQPPQNVPQPYMDRQPFSDRQPYDNRLDQRRQDHRQQDSRQQDSRQQDSRQQDNRQQDHRQPDNRNGDQGRQNDHGRPDQRNLDRQGGDRQPHEGRDRQYDNRRNYQDRSNQGGQDSSDRGPERNGHDRPQRDYDNRNFRNRNRDYRDQPREARDQRQPGLDEPGNGLPAFITGPSRPQQESEPQPDVAESAAASNTAVSGERADETNEHMRPRRRRRPKADFAEGRDGDGREEGRQDTPASDPVGE